MLKQLNKQLFSTQVDKAKLFTKAELDKLFLPTLKQQVEES